MDSIAGKIHHIAALIGIIVCRVVYTFVTNIAIDKRVVSTYFGNIAFAYEDYGLPYCFSASVLTRESVSQMDIRRKQWQRLTRTEN